MGRGKKKQRRVIDLRIGPTLEQQQRGAFVSAGMAHKRVAVIDTMLTRGQLTDDEFRRLSYYRDQAALADRSTVKSCLDHHKTGGAGHISSAVLSAQLAVGRIERDLGSLADIARAVAVDDVSLSQWCVNKHGGRERYDGKGELIAIVPVAEKRVMELAAREIRMAAHRIVP